MATYERLDYGSDDGSQWGGAATDKLGCFGATPVVQRTTATSVTTTASTTTTPYGYTTAAQADAIVTAVNAIIVNLTDIGITA